VKAVVQRVHWAEVLTNGEVAGRIDAGLLVYVGVVEADGPDDADGLADKVAGIRIFEDGQGKLNRGVRDIRGGVLAIPNFTLVADTRKGRRPSFVGAARPESARTLYDTFVAALRNRGCTVANGAFGATMTVCSAAAGPVNVILDTGSRPSVDPG